MFKNKVFSTYLLFLTRSYENHPCISVNIFVNFGKLTSNLHYNVQKSDVFDLFVPKSQ